MISMESLTDRFDRLFRSPPVYTSHHGNITITDLTHFYLLRISLIEGLEGYY
jgi:hypothetical protein